MMTYEEALAYLNRHTWSESRLGLERTQELLERVGNPEKGMHFIHVAGTNGKGSTCAMLASVLKEAGYKTGMYPSPYIEEFRERIQIDGVNISEEDLAKYTEIVSVEADAMEDHPTHFELITAVGLLYFRDMKVDVTVLEVGMGGIYDSTNVIDAPDAAVITNLGMDHMEYLGNTLAEIAWNKAGIIKPGSRVISYESEQEALDVIKKTALEKGDELRVADFSQIVPLDHTLRLQRFSYKGTEYELSLAGVNQLHNCSVVLETIDALREAGYDIPEDAVHEGLKKVSWPARFEIFCEDPVVILDGGHNPQCAEALAVNLDTYLPGEKLTCIIGMLADKDYVETVRILKPYIAQAYTLTPSNSRALSAEALAEVMRKEGIEAESCDDAGTALEKSLASGRNIAAFGSLYMAGSMRPVMRRKFL